LFPQRLKISRSLRKTLKKRLYTASMDCSFDGVIDACAGPRRDGDGTWLMPEMIEAYRTLHRRHIAHSVEIWAGDDLVGGLYGVALGRVFFGESMFSRVSDASKLALVYLCQKLLDWGYRLIDCQVHTEHLTRLGAEEIPRKHFTDLLTRWCAGSDPSGSWYGGRRQIGLPAPSERTQPP
jgi:leucyl/phenylalanyl-tRNA--protein transferase